MSTSDFVVDPLIATPMSQAILETRDVQQVLGRDVVQVRAGVPTGKFYTSQAPFAVDARAVALESAREQRWESADTTVKVAVGLVEYRAADRPDSIGYHCPTVDDLRTVDRRPGLGIAVEDDYSYGCQETSAGRTDIVVQVSLPSGSAASEVTDAVTALAGAQLARLDADATGQAGQRVPVDASNSALLAALRGTVLLAVLGLAFMATVPAVLLDRATWTRLRSYFPGARTNATFLDVDRQAVAQLARSRALGFAQLALALWVLRLTEELPIGVAASLALVVVVFVGSSLGVRRVTAGRLRTQSRRRYDPRARSVLLVGAAVSLGLAGLGIGAAVTGAGAAAGGMLPGLPDWQVESSAAAWRLLGSLLFLSSYLPLALARRLAQRRVTIADDRPPVLLLRSFADDGIRMRNRSMDRVGIVDRLALRRWERFEEVAGAALARLGPLLAVGEPGERLMPELGAARVHLSHDTWQHEVARLTDESAMVAMTLGRSEGLVWEMHRLVNTGVLHKTVFLVPPVSRRERRARLAVLSRELHIPWHQLDDTKTRRVVVAVCWPLLAEAPLVVVSRGPDDVSYGFAVDACARALAGGSLQQCGDRVEDVAPPVSPFAPPVAQTIPAGKAIRPRYLTRQPWFWGAALQAAITVGLSATLGVTLGIDGSTASIQLPTGTRITSVVAADGNDVWVLAGQQQLVETDFGSGQYRLVTELPSGSDVVTYDSSTVFVAQSGGGTLSALDLQSGDVKWSTPTVAGTRGLVEMDGRLFRAAAERSVVEVLDADTGAVVGAIPLGSAPWGLVACDGVLWAALPEADALVSLDPDALTRLDEVSVAYSPTAVACWQGKVLAVSYVAHRVYVLGSDQPVLVMTLPQPAIAARGGSVVVEGYEKFSIFSSRGVERHVTWGGEVSLLVGDDGEIFVAEDNEVRRYAG